MAEDSALEKLADTLRAEATEVKDCFTRYSFQTFMFSATVLGLIARYGDTPLARLSSVLVTALIVTVARIGTYKYFTANRNYGYELHVARRRALHQIDPTRWPDELLEVSWEEAMRAWRVVQASCFRSLYTHGPWVPNFRRAETRRESYERQGLWFEPALLVKLPGSTAHYHAGTYLANMLLILYVFLVASLVPPMILAAELVEAGSSLSIWAIMWVVVLVVISAMRTLATYRRRVLLEREFMSIHSCGIMWEAVVLAHLLAQRHALQRPETGLAGYTKALAEVAVGVQARKYDLHEWIAWAETVIKEGEAPVPLKPSNETEKDEPKRGLRTLGL